MKLLAAYYTHKPGGLCKRLYRLLNALVAADHEVVYCTFDPPPANALNPKVQLSLLPCPISNRSSILFWGYAVSVMPWLILRAARRNHSERALAFGAFYSTMLLPTKLLQKIPVVLFLRSLTFQINAITQQPPLLQRLAAAIDRLGIRAASTVICMTESMRQEAQRFAGITISSELLPNEVSAQQQTPPHVPTTPPMILCSGVLDQRKNVSLLLHALSDLAGEWRVIIAGTGKLLPDIQQQIACNATLQARVSCIGWSNELPSLLQQATLVVHPSLHEGVSNSILEALSAGVPVLASRIPEHQELFAEELPLFSPHAPSDLREKLARVLSSPADYQQLKQSCDRVAARLRFDWDSRAVASVVSTTQI